MIDAMKVNLSGAMAHPIIAQCTVTGTQVNQMTEVARIVLSCLVDAGMTTVAKRSIAISVKGLKVQPLPPMIHEYTVKIG